MALMKLCAWPGCRAQIPYEQKYCLAHVAAGELREKKRREEAEARRYKRCGSAASRGYSYKWREVSKKFLTQHPLCVVCERQGVVKAATCVDHIIPHRGDQKLFWDQANWQSLCQECHSRKTAAQDGGFGNRPVR